MKYIILALLTLAYSSSYSQTIVTGKVADKETEEPLAYASVIIADTSIGVLSDEEGVFELTIPQKHQKDSLVINYIGYEPMQVAITTNQYEIKLNPSENRIDEVVVTPENADSIMQEANNRYVSNHFKPNTKQAGFMRSTFRERGNIFQVAETSYNVFYKQSDDKEERVVIPKRSRMVIDSAKYKFINEVFHLKWDTLLIEPTNFISVMQSFSSKEGESKESKKWTNEYEYVGRTKYQGREAYEIDFKSYRKKTKFVEGKYLIDVDTYAYLSVSFSSTNEAQINKLVPFTARVALGVLGYKFSIKKMKGKQYYRYNGEFFELDKGTMLIAADVARGGDWVRGDIIQEYYLQEQKPVNSIPKEPKFFTSEIVASFAEGFFKEFHLPTASKTHKLIEAISEKNNQFSGEIYSEKHEKWIKKQERKKAKKQE